MKLNRLLAYAAIALLVVGGLGTVAARSLAQTATAPAAQSQDCAANQADDASEAQNAAEETDTLDAQCGDQTGPDDAADANESGDEEDAAPTGTPAISAEAAQKSAEDYLKAGAASEVELEDENGQLLYSVEIGATDVKIDAMTGAVLGVETGQD